MRRRPRNTASRNRRTVPGTAAVEEVFGKKPRNTSKNAEIIWKSLENHGNILKQLLKTYGHIYIWNNMGKNRKKGASFTHMDRYG